MKKLMFAAAIAASAAAFADPINAISFENSDYALIDNATNLTARADKPDPGGRGDDGTYFLYQGDGSDSSIVTNVGASFTANITGYYDGLENYSNQKYLALDTEGGTLWRSIGPLSGNNDALGTARTVAATGTYLDTLVQFTVTEDEAPAVGADDKLAIWLQAGEGTTNLMVRANYWASAGEDPVATNFTVTGVSIVPGTWYRLTVKAIPSITSQGAPFPAFQIFIDGTSIAAATPQYDEDFQDAASARYAAGIGDLIAANKLFPTLAERPSDLEDVTLQGVGFQGTGAVDEIVWTDDDLFSAATVDFTLTIPSVANADASISGDYTIENGTVQGIPSGTEVTVTWTAAEGYTFPNGSKTMTKTITVNGDQTVDVSDVESSLSKETFTVTVTDIENATIAATTNNTDLVDALSENTITNQYTVEYGATVTVTATAAEGYEYAIAPEGWTLTEGVLSIETNVTAAVELAAPVPTLSTVTIAVPTAATGLVYDGTEKTGVAAGTGYTLSGTTAATAAGAYTATATLEQGYAWEGGLTGDQTINWSIAQATVTATVSLDPASATFDSAKTAPSAYTTPSISFGDETLAEGTDYTVAWSPAQVTESGEYTCTVSPVAGGNYTFTVATATLTITAQQTEGWVDDVSSITAGTKASEQYSSLAGTEVANADAAQLTTWAKGVGNVAFADAGKDEINVEAFLLNIANDSTSAQIDAAKEAFVLNITVAADGTPTVTLPSGKTYNGMVQMKGSNDLSTWTDVDAASKTYHFYKYELSLPAAE